MSSTSSVSSVSTNAYGGISGLMSGMDTETLVKNMTYAVRSKIAKQNQNKQLLLWKMDAYRSVRNSLQSFADKFFDRLNTASYALSSSFYTSKVTTTKGEYADSVSVTGTSASAGSFGIQSINSLASKANFVSQTPATTQKITSETIDFSQEGVSVNALAGQDLTFILGNEKFTVTIDKDFNSTDKNSIVNAINSAISKTANSASGVNLSTKVKAGLTEDGKISLSVVDSAYTGSVRVASGEKTTFLEDVFGIDSGASFSYDKKLEGKIEINSERVAKTTFNNSLANKELVFDLNGVQKSVKISEMTYDGDGKPDYAKFLKDMQQKFDKAFGSGKVEVDWVGEGDSGKLTFKTKDNSSVLTSVGAKGFFGIEQGDSNRVDMNVEAGKAGLNDDIKTDENGKFTLKINDIEKTFDPKKSIKQIIDEINNDSELGVNIQYLKNTDRFVVSATKNGADGGVDIEDVGGNFAKLLFGEKLAEGEKLGEGLGKGKYQINEGTNAQIVYSYDGGKTTFTMESDTNVFAIDGLTVTANSVFNAGDGKVGVTLEQKANTDKIVDTVKSIVAEYNTLIQLVNGEVSTKYDRKYPPLTDEQKSEMTDKQIEDWEKTAKTGVLFNDPTLRSLSEELRRVLPYASNIGLSTSDDWRDNGKIVIDEDALRKAIEENPEAVASFFTAPKDSSTGSSGGMLTRMKAITDGYASNIGEKGILVKMVGVEGSYSVSESSYYKKIKDIEDAITRLESTKKTQEDRYYKQFTSLETYISKISAQSSWLTQQLSGG